MAFHGKLMSIKPIKSEVIKVKYYYSHVIFIGYITEIISKFTNEFYIAYFDKSVSDLSETAQKQLTKYFQKGTKVTNVHAVKLLNKTDFICKSLTDTFKSLKKFLSYGL